MFVVSEYSTSKTSKSSSLVFLFKPNNSHALAWLAKRTTDSMASSFFTFFLFYSSTPTSSFNDLTKSYCILQNFSSDEPKLSYNPLQNKPNGINFFLVTAQGSMNCREECRQFRNPKWYSSICDVPIGQTADRPIGRELPSNLTIASR